MRPTLPADRSPRGPSGMRLPIDRTTSANTATSTSSLSNPDLYSSRRHSPRASIAPGSYGYSASGHKRGRSDLADFMPATSVQQPSSYHDANAAGAYQSMRQSLRPLPQQPSMTPPPFKRTPSTTIRDLRRDDDRHRPVSLDGGNLRPAYLAESPRAARPQPSGLGRMDSLRVSPIRPAPAQLTAPDLETLQKSSTSHLRTLSKLGGRGASEELVPAQDVVGMHGRRRLQRSGSVDGRTVAPTGWGRDWMDRQRQFLQAYEYLCHIGEAKEWIERVMHKPLPPIVQLEEALRDGVTLAELVQALKPHRSLRIFRHEKLQFRHSDNIALFFRFLAEVELPELFRFELIDLYEKKNIPKVIYCIHALSWLLYRQELVAFRIGNLVGQLEFETHELEEMQKGLDRAGVSMPSFSGMGASFGAEPEPEPVETEEERTDRMLHQSEGAVMRLQAQMRGATMRMSLGRDMQRLWNAEPRLIELQARLRGDWARQIVDYRLGMRRFAVNLQCASRGFLVRQRQREQADRWKTRASDVVLIQSLVRARKVKEEVRLLKRSMKKDEHGLHDLQAAIKGTLQRGRVAQQLDQVYNTTDSIIRLQSAARGFLARASLAADVDALHMRAGVWCALQAVARGRAVRKETCGIQQRLQSHAHSTTQLQARVRGRQCRQQIAVTTSALARLAAEVAQLQAATRAMLLRKLHRADLHALQSHSPALVDLQALVRGGLYRNAIDTLLTRLEDASPSVIELQAFIRGMLSRNVVDSTLAQLEAEEGCTVALQAAARGVLVRARYAEKQRFFKENMEKVIKVQSFVRGRLQGEAYKSLTSGKNPPVGTVKGFVHLLNDSDFDFDEEIEFERLRKTVVQHVRQNELAEQYIDQLDIKIALLVKNKITLDEVVKHQKHFGGHMGRLLTNTEMPSKDGLDLKALNKNSRKKLEHYQELFFVLQTQPQYLARLFKRTREQGMAEKDSKRIENLTLSLFGYAQKRREEYYLLKLIGRSVKEEIESCQSVQDYLRGNFFWSKLLSAYVRSPRDRKYLRDLLGPVVRENVVDNPELDLESDPMQIYRSAINNEELRTGQRSQRPPDITREEAIKDPETRKTFTDHLQDLRDIADQLLAALEEQMHKMPYGIRWVAQQIFQSLSARFPREDPGHLLHLVGHWLWRSYLQPALTQPEAWGVVDHALAPLQKRNLGEVAKVFSQMAAGRLFGGENVFLQPLNAYVSESITTLGEIWTEVVAVPDAETRFDIDEFNDLYSRTKPTLYIKMADIFAVHHLIAGDIASVCPNKDDMLRDLVHELGNAQSNENEMLGVGSTEISLTLNPKFHDIEDPEADVKALFVETKRCILYIIRVQSGGNLLEILVKPITMDDEEKWMALVEEECSSGSKKRAAYADATTLVDITAMSYAELKRTALENIVRLEGFGRLSRHNHYQDLLNAIAIDIRTKHRRRIQRQRELEGVRMTLANLDEKTVWLEQQLQSYNDYIEQAMVTLQNKKGKKRFLLPFTKQYNHERELQRSGRVPKFGSFKYSARTLADKGVLVSYEGYGERSWDKINLTISSDKVGIFFLEGSMGSIQIPGASAQVPLDDLLQAQFNNHTVMALFEGQMKLNVNLFLHLLFRKFYRDE
ncbi:MAG: hypothetical protein M1838_001140 [Thelocarpon superellum]|nr:MAG: hypothetical protein M1838_001140 [Thelocarpon superellum]